MKLPGFGDGGYLNTTCIIVLVVFGTCLGLLELNLDESQISHPDGFPANTVNNCYSIFPIANSILMVTIALFCVGINLACGQSLGSDMLEHYSKEEVSIKESVEKICTNAGLMNALIFSCVVSMCVTTPPNNPCGSLSQIYMNLAFNALGTSFYGIVSSVAPVMYLAGLTEEDAHEYMTVNNNVRGIGASVSSIGSAAAQLILAIIVYAWSLYGAPMGIGMCVGINALFVACINRFAFQAKWAPRKQGATLPQPPEPAPTSHNNSFANAGKLRVQVCLQEQEVIINPLPGNVERVRVQRQEVAE